MQISDYILSRLRHSKLPRIVVGIAGRAGAGKTTLAGRIAEELRAADVPTIAYSGDWHFVLDSKGRKEWLKEKWRAGLDAYLSAMNQFRWWDFDAIFADLAALQDEKSVQIPKAYDRTTGTKTLTIRLEAIQRGVILYENCILGTLENIPFLDVVVLVNTPDQVCLERTLRKDVGRRTVPDIATRFLMTSYSENIFLRTLRERFPARTVACDSEGNFGPYPEVQDVTHIPVPIPSGRPQSRRKGTIFCDLDGTLIKHVPVPSPNGDDVELLDGSVEKLAGLRKEGYMVVLTTSRSQSNVFGVLQRLQALGLEYDQIVCDLPIGPRHLINDSKGDEVRAIAHPLRRDAGIRELVIH